MVLVSLLKAVNRIDVRAHVKNDEGSAEEERDGSESQQEKDEARACVLEWSREAVVGG